MAPATQGEETDDSNAWLWVLPLGLVLLVVLVVALVLRQRRRRAAAAAWRDAARRAVGQGALLVSELGTDAGGRGDREPALQRRLHELDASLGSLQTGSPTSDDGRTVGEVRAVLSELQSALAADLALRIGPPAPTADQLTTSDAVIVQRVRDLDVALDRLAQATADLA